MLFQTESLLQYIAKPVQAVYFTFNRSVFRTQSTSKIELFSKIVNSFPSLTIFEGSSILHVWKGSEYASVQ